MPTVFCLCAVQSRSATAHHTTRILRPRACPATRPARRSPPASTATSAPSRCRTPPATHAVRSGITTAPGTARPPTAPPAVRRVGPSPRSAAAQPCLIDCKRCALMLATCPYFHTARMIIAHHDLQCAAGPAVIQAAIIQQGRFLSCILSFLGGDTRVRSAELWLLTRPCLQSWDSWVAGDELL